MSLIVLDGSMALSWVLPDELTAKTQVVRSAIQAGARTTVPSLWGLEVANGLLMAERRKRISQADTTAALAVFDALPIEIDEEVDRRASKEIIGLARQNGLSVYDAAYLELAMRLGATLASLDEPLRAAAKKLKVPVLPENLD